MNLDKWTKYTGEIPIVMSALIIIVVSVGLGVSISYFQNPTLGLMFGLACGISGFLLVVLPNAIMLKRIWNDELSFDREVKE